MVGLGYVGMKLAVVGSSFGVWVCTEHLLNSGFVLTGPNSFPPKPVDGHLMSHAWFTGLGFRVGGA